MKPVEEEKSFAPALDAGLDVLEILASKRVAGFNELCAALPMSKASVARILKTLSLRGYAVKSGADGKWRPGPRMSFPGGGLPAVERLRAEAPAVLKSFVDKTGCTALCLYWSGKEYQSIVKEQREGGIVMMDVGVIVRDLSTSPWGWLFYLSLDARGKKEALRQVADPLRLKERLPEWSAHIRKNGFAFDDHEIFPERMRLGAPVYDHRRQLVGAIGTACTQLSVPTELFAEFTDELVRHAELLSGKISGGGVTEEEPAK